jgi:putative ABC transport system permease protein
MKFHWLVWSALARKPLRSALTIMAISVAFMLFGLLKGFTLGFEAMAQQVPAYRLDVHRRSLSLGGGMPFAYVAAIKSIPGVQAVTFLEGLRGVYKDQPQPITLLGVDVDTMQDVMSDIHTAASDFARFRSSPTSALVGRDLALAQGWQIGDRITFKTSGTRRRDGSDVWSVDVAGIWDADDAYPSREVLIHYDFLDNERVERRGLLSEITLLVDETSSPADVAGRIDQTFLNSSVPTRTIATRDGVRLSLQRIGDIEFFVNAVVGSSLFAILFVAGGTLMQSVRERTPELAVLRTIGFGRGLTVALLGVEGLVLAVSGAFLGITIARVCSPVVYASMMGTTLSLPLTLYVYAAVAAALVAAVAVAFPAVRAYRISVVDALAGR